MDKYALVLAGGEEVNKEVIFDHIKNADLIIGADKGAETAYKYNFNVDLIVGDFDSININILNKFHTKIIEYPKEKDKTDLELVLDYIVEEGYKKIIILNALGNRIDHTLGNLFLLEKYSGQDIKIIDNNSEAFVINETEVIVKNRKNYILSIIPISEKLEIEKLLGVKYPLSDKIVKRGSSLCISNLIKEEKCLISIKKGKAFIIITKIMEE